MKVKKSKPGKKIKEINPIENKHISEESYMDEKGMVLVEDPDHEYPFTSEDIDNEIKEEEEEYDHYYGE